MTRPTVAAPASCQRLVTNVALMLVHQMACQRPSLPVQAGFAGDVSSRHGAETNGMRKALLLSRPAGLGSGQCRAFQDTGSRSCPLDLLTDI